MQNLPLQVFTKLMTRKTSSTSRLICCIDNSDMVASAQRNNACGLCFFSYANSDFPHQSLVFSNKRCIGPVQIHGQPFGPKDDSLGSVLATLADS